MHESAQTRCTSRCTDPGKKELQNITNFVDTSLFINTLNFAGKIKMFSF